MSAMVKDDNISTETDILFGKDWLAVVKSRSRPGDMVVCFAEQHANGSSQTLGRILQTNLEAPLYIVSGLRPDNKADSNWLAQFVAWSGSIALIFGFFLLQVKIDHIGKDWTHLTLLLLTIPAELWLIWMWNNLFG
jgi:hypothetical protein